MKVLHVASSSLSVVNASFFAAASSSEVVSSVESLPALSSAMRPGFDVETDGRVVLAELDGERQTDVTQADDADLGVFERSQGSIPRGSRCAFYMALHGRAESRITSQSRPTRTAAASRRSRT